MKQYKETKIIIFRKIKNKTTLLTENIIVYREKSWKKSIGKYLELTFIIQVVGSKVNVWNQLHFYIPATKSLEKKLKW